VKVGRCVIENQVRYVSAEDAEVRVLEGDIFGVSSPTSATYPVSSVKFCSPCDPRSFRAVGLNYAAHIERQEHALDAERIRQDSQESRPWHKGTSCIIGHGGNIVLPLGADYVHYEGELAIVIGHITKGITADQAPRYIFGYTCANYVSAEGLWSKDLSNWRRKCTDTVGPWIETDIDPHNAEIVTRLNGIVNDSGNTSEMIPNCYDIVSRMSQLVTLFPGDMILTGAPGSVEAIHPGDTIEIDISGVGTLKNFVI
jgi:2-keto-4-pentenoate hydratase/2-oxohepta-3-ene-1,7-dioic acid hydratase in catechol pathway